MHSIYLNLWLFFISYFLIFQFEKLKNLIKKLKKRIISLKIIFLEKITILKIVILLAKLVHKKNLQQQNYYKRMFASIFANIFTLYFFLQKQWFTWMLLKIRSFIKSCRQAASHVSPGRTDHKIIWWRNQFFLVWAYVNRVKFGSGAASKRTGNLHYLAK